MLATRLEDADLRSLADRLGVPGGKVPDDGMSVNGFPVSNEGTAGRGSLWVGLGPPEGDTAPRRARGRDPPREGLTP